MILRAASSCFQTPAYRTPYWCPPTDAPAWATKDFPGLFPGATYDLHCVQLEPGDAVLFATDGLHELRDSKDNDFSWDKLAEIWKKCHGRPAQESLDLLFKEAMRFAQNGQQNDDITAVVLKVR